ncbi:hypothetical protein D8I24_7810 [Cupriavidus necator H850]|nr:hypothetical protein D8I24_7810 [Cupriavidus necator H850]
MRVGGSRILRALTLAVFIGVSADQGALIVPGFQRGLGRAAGDEAAGRDDAGNGLRALALARVRAGASAGAAVSAACRQYAGRCDRD